MKLAFSTNAFTGFSLVEAMQRIRDLGYEGVEIMADQPHLWPPDVDEEQVQRILEMARILALELCNMNGFMMRAVGDIHHPSWIESDARLRSRRQEHTRACMALAHALSIPSVSTEPGGPLEGMGEAEAASLFAEGLRTVMQDSLYPEVRLLIEPEPGLLFTKMEETHLFIRDTGLANLGINADLGHFYCVGQDPASIILNHASHLEHIHLEDIAADRVHHHLIPGEGAMDFPAIFKALHTVEYAGFLTVELYPYEDEPVQAASKAYNFLVPFLKG